jgi:hypothetical protein
MSQATSDDPGYGKGDGGGKKGGKYPKAEKVIYGDCDGLKEIAEKLIAKDHYHLATARIRYVIKSKATKRGGVPIPGNVYKMGGKFEFLTGFDFVIEVAQEIWNDYSPAQRTALTDHYLARCVGEPDEEDGDDMKWSLRAPPVQEFPEVAERRGAWNDDLVDMQKSLGV